MNCWASYWTGNCEGKMMKHRPSHTTKQNKAKCLHYRSGKRCGRVARFIVSHSDHRAMWDGVTVCEECMNALLQEGYYVHKESKKGFHVRSGGFSGWITREYVPIE